MPRARRPAVPSKPPTWGSSSPRSRPGHGLIPLHFSQKPISESEGNTMHKFHNPYGVLPPLATEVFDLTDTTKRVRRFYEDFIPDNGRPPTFLEAMDGLSISYDDLWDS